MASTRAQGHNKVGKSVSSWHRNLWIIVLSAPQNHSCDGSVFWRPPYCGIDRFDLCFHLQSLTCTCLSFADKAKTVCVFAAILGALLALAALSGERLEVFLRSVSGCCREPPPSKTPTSALRLVLIADSVGGNASPSAWTAGRGRPGNHGVCDVGGRAAASHCQLLSAGPGYIIMQLNQPVSGVWPGRAPTHGKLWLWDWNSDFIG